MELLILVLSIIVYIIYGKVSIIYTLAIGTISFFCSKSKQKSIILIAIVLNIIGLIFFKTILLNNFNNNIIVPLGVSYFTLGIISYLIDVYKGKYEPEKNIKYFFLYILYFPCIFIGPINRYNDFKKSITIRKRLNNKYLLNSILRIMFGLFKKLIIAGRINILIQTTITNNYDGIYVLFALIMYSFQIYADFSGGIDIVMGVSNMFGIELKENFNTPYLSETIKEFWNNWHITLGNWLKDYVYIPLGGNKKGKIRTIINKILTFLVSGLWHGINYIIWGFLHGIITSFSDKFKTKNKYINIFTTFLIVSILWCFFIWQDPLLAINKVISIFRINNFKVFINGLNNLGLNLYNYIILMISLLILTIYDINKKRGKKILNLLSDNKKRVLIYILFIVVIVYGIYGIGFEKSEFIYSKF